MALSKPFIAFGIHSQVPYQRSDMLPLGILRVLGSSSFSFSASFEDLVGGSNRYFWASELKSISSEFTSSVKSVEGFLVKLFLGAERTVVDASSSGTVSEITAVKGTGVLGATGILEVGLTAGKTEDLKTGNYVVLVTDTDKVDVYCLTDVDFARGTNLSFIDDSLKITETKLAVAASTKVAIPNTGISITGGGGTIGMSVGDTASFQVMAPHGRVDQLIIGKTGSEIPAHGQVIVSAKRSDGSLMEIDLPHVVGGGFPINLEEGTFFYCRVNFSCTV